MFWIIVAVMFLANVAWWAWADRRVRRLALSVWTRLAVAAWVGPQLLYLIAFIVWPSWGRDAHHTLPAWWLGIFYLWSLVILPATIVVLRVAAGIRWVGRQREGHSPVAEPRATDSGSDVATTQLTSARGRSDGAAKDDAETWTRRRVLQTTAAVAVSPLITSAGVAYGRHSLYDLRVRRAEVSIPGLPADLDGLSIAHITDVHTGKFVDGPYLARARDLANSLHADLHLLTGDLIDLSVSDLPVAIDFVHQLDPKHALVMCEGNHDLIDSPAAFYGGCRRASIPLLVNDTALLRVPGRSTPIRLLGIPWDSRNGSGVARKDRFAAPVAGLASLVQPGEFPLLLAHHPDAFDAAAANRIPLTLSGHTHGGLLMLSESIGPGPLLYNYWSGLYRSGDCFSFVANGVGSWFPVRTAARPEIAHLILRRA